MQADLRRLQDGARRRPRPCPCSSTRASSTRSTRPAPRPGCSPSPAARTWPPTPSAGQPFPVARLRAAAPQAYLAVAGRGVTLAGLRRSKATRQLPAVRDRRFALVDGAALTDTGPRAVSEVLDAGPICCTPRCASREPLRRGAAGRVRDADRHRPAVPAAAPVAAPAPGRRGLAEPTPSAAFRAEMRYYADHCHEGADAGRARRAAHALRRDRARRARHRRRPRRGGGAPRATRSRSASTPTSPRCSRACERAGVGGGGRLELGLLAAARRSRRPASRSGSCSTRPRPARRSPTPASSGGRCAPSASSPAGRCTSATPRRPTAPARGRRASTCASSTVARRAAGPDTITALTDVLALL